MRTIFRFVYVTIYRPLADKIHASWVSMMKLEEKINVVHEPTKETNAIQNPTEKTNVKPNKKHVTFAHSDKKKQKNKSHETYCKCDDCSNSLFDLDSDGVPTSSADAAAVQDALEMVDHGFSCGCYECEKRSHWSDKQHQRRNRTKRRKIKEKATTLLK